MAAYEIKQSSTAYPLVFLLVSSSDHITGLTGATATVTIRKPGGSFASPSGAVTEIANGWYQVAGNATDSGTLGPLILHATATGADPVDMLFEVVAYDPQDAVRQGMTAIPNTACTTNASLITSGTGSDQISVSSGKVLLQATQTGVTIPTVTTVGTLTTYTGNTPQTGDAYARIGAAGAGLTAIGDTRLGNLDATISSRLAPGGTLATVTAVTNPVTLTGDLSATMKTSVTTAATAATPTISSVSGSVGSVAGNVGGNVVGSVGSVASGVTVTTNNDKTGYTLTVTPPTAAQIAAAVNTDTVNVTTAGSPGKVAALLNTALNGTSVFTTAALVNAPTGGSAPTVSQIATAVWQDTTAGDFTVSGSPGYKLFTSGVPVVDKTGFALTSAYDPAKTAAQAGDAMTLVLTQAVPTSNTAQTVGDALNAARAGAFGAEAIVGTTYTVYAADGTTAVRVFTLNDATNPTSRT